MREIIITTHGRERLLDRTQCKARNLPEFLSNVWEQGKTIDDYKNKSAMYKYLSNINKEQDRIVRCKGNTVFLFNRSGTVFITCYEMPQKVLQGKFKGVSYR